MIRLILKIMKTILLILPMLYAFNCFSQIPEIQWQQCYGTSDTDKSYAIAGTGNGYMIATEVRTGEGLTNYHGSHDIWIINIDTIGDIIWEKCYGGSVGEIPKKIIAISENEYYILGTTGSTDGDVQSYHHGESDTWVVKINGQGDILWEKCFGSSGPEETRDMILTTDGGFVLLSRIHAAGGDVSQYYGSWDNWMCKCDSLGNIEWEKTLGNEWLDSGVSMIINSEGNIMMIGAAAHYGGIVDCNADDGYGDVWLVELNLSGQIIWQRCYGGSYYDIGIDIEELENGYIFVASSSSNDGDVTDHHGPGGTAPDAWPDIWVVKINNSGEIIWQKSLGGYDGDYAKYICTKEDSGIIVIGTTWSHDGDITNNHSVTGTYDTDLWIVKLTPEGEIEWQQCYGGWGTERLETPHTILKKDDYNYVIASSTDYGPSYDVACTPTGGNGIDRDVWIFEIDSIDTSGIIGSTFIQNSILVYPNPAKDYVCFEYILPEDKEDVMFSIKNMQGIETANFNLHDKKGVKVWDTRDVKQGVYFYSFKRGLRILKRGKVVIIN